MTTEFHPLLAAILPRTEKVYFRLWDGLGMTQEEIADVFETTADHIEEVIERAWARCEGWGKPSRP